MMHNRIIFIYMIYELSLSASRQLRIPRLWWQRELQLGQRHTKGTHDRKPGISGNLRPEKTRGYRQARWIHGLISSWLVWYVLRLFMLPPPVANSAFLLLFILSWLSSAPTHVFFAWFHVLFTGSQCSMLRFRRLLHMITHTFRWGGC